MVTKRAGGPGLDRIDIKILAFLQRDGRATIKSVADKVGLSARACLERVRRLEASGVIAGYHAVIELAKLSRPVTVFTEIVLEKQASHARFEQSLSAIEEVVECWEVSGAVDYVARFVCADLAAYEALTSTLLEDPKLGVGRIVSHIALRQVRTFAGYPQLAPEARPKSRRVTANSAALRRIDGRSAVRRQNFSAKRSIAGPIFSANVATAASSG